MVQKEGGAFWAYQRFARARTLRSSVPRNDKMIGLIQSASMLVSASCSESPMKTARRAGVTSRRYSCASHKMDSRVAQLTPAILSNIASPVSNVASLSPLGRPTRFGGDIARPSLHRGIPPHLCELAQNWRRRSH